MRCTDATRAAALAALLPFASCTPSPSPPQSPTTAPVEAIASAPSSSAPATAAPSDPGRAVPQAMMGPQLPVRDIAQLRLLVARRIVEANPERTYLGAAPDPLLAIPVLLIELNADGSVRRIEVLRPPRQARDTTQIAIDAVRRSAPYGDLSHVPPPRKFSETFLFDDERRFKPRTLEP